MALFALQLKFTDQDRRMEVRPAHRDYLAELYDAGKLHAAGPFGDQSGALLIYDVADEAELREILADDPYTAADVYEIVTLQEWLKLFPSA
ncbi:YciI family protein [Kribbella sp. CA-293567]|uniref:YciI family protein n=1 Tax=Kribbella sp. CA-293567 TaxID=3002436 RepID=UPI0022DE7B6B|nr:muconolactone Delta-isomerase family protein [Kribbella sp. CA-293567]WBQ03056.1 YciI family protein [Kribbella sp. CA-293567]